MPHDKTKTAPDAHLLNNIVWDCAAVKKTNTKQCD